MTIQTVVKRVIQGEEGDPVEYAAAYPSVVEGGELWITDEGDNTIIDTYPAGTWYGFICWDDQFESEGTPPT